MRARARASAEAYQETLDRLRAEQAAQEARLGRGLTRGEIEAIALVELYRISLDVEAFTKR